MNYKCVLKSANTINNLLFYLKKSFYFSFVQIYNIYFFMSIKISDSKLHHTIELTEKCRPPSNAVNSEKEEYEPYKNRQVEHPTTWVSFFISLMVHWTLNSFARHCIIDFFVMSFSNIIFQYIYSHSWDHILTSSYIFFFLFSIFLMHLG